MIRIVDKSKCCGCTTCEQVCPKKCISMIEDAEGFLYPEVNIELCIDCNLCEKVCPVLNPYERAIEEPESYACKSLDQDLVSKSSSGGMFTLLATSIINSGGVVFGAKFDENWNIVHDYAETLDGLIPFRGSKYVQSKLGNSFSKVKEFLLQNKLVMFVGTPCQVAGLHHFLRKNYDNLFTIDIVCHSIASPKVWRLYLDNVARGSKISNVTFRDKSQGWRSYGLHIQGFGNEGDTVTLDRGKQTENLFMRGFLEDLTVRPSCSHCPARNYVTKSDIMLADCWKLDQYHPEWDDNKGMSLAIILSDKGKRLFEKLSAGIFVQKIPYEEVEDKGVHAPITRSTPPHRYRRYFFANLSDRNIVDLIAKCLRKQDRKRQFKKNIRLFINGLPGINLVKTIRSNLKK